MTTNNDVPWAEITEDATAEYAITDVHHRSGGENGGQHNVFVTVDPPAPDLTIGWTWKDRNVTTEPAPPKPLGKGVPGSGGDVPIFPGQYIEVWLERAGQRVSDSVAHLHAEFASAPWEVGNTMHHQSYDVRFQRRSVVVTPPDSGDSTARMAAAIALLKEGRALIADGLVRVDEASKLLA